VAIDQSGFKDRVGIGLVWQADLFYNPDQKKYELENPKQLFDTD
jgi:enolase